MGSHPTSPVKVTDLLINMVSKAAAQNQEFLLDLAALQVGAGLGWRVLGGSRWAGECKGWRVQDR